MSFAEAKHGEFSRNDMGPTGSGCTTPSRTSPGFELGWRDALMPSAYGGSQTHVEDFPSARAPSEERTAPRL